MTELWSSDHGADSKARSLTTATYRRLKSDILDCNLRPGDRLKIMDLSAVYGCSPGAVREALTRLAAEELVVSEDQRGFRVTPVSRSDLLDLTRTRIDLESLALRYSISKGGLEWQQEIVSVLFKLSQAPVLDEAGRLDELWNRYHLDFHMALISACGSPRLLRLCRAFSHQSQRFRMLTLRHFQRGESAGAEHNALAGATLAGDADLAVRLLADHYNRTTDVIIEIDRRGETSALASD